MTAQYHHDQAKEAVEQDIKRDSQVSDSTYFWTDTAKSVLEAQRRASRAVTS